jgi:NAD-dependent SIR2 family protein deacetylase
LRSAVTTQNVDEREIAVTILRSLVVEGHGRIVDDSTAG